MKSVVIKPVSFSPIIIYSIFFFLIGTGDAVMSYLSPIYIAGFMSNSLFMGLVISFSSVIGLACDFFIPKIFPDRPYSFYTWMAIMFGILFPFSLLLLPPWAPVLLLSMAFWGIYYEFIHFSSFNFVGTFVRRHFYASSWGIISAVRATAYFSGPLIAMFFLNYGFQTSIASSLFFYFTAMLCFYMFTRFNNLHRSASPSLPIHRSIRSIFSTWHILSRPLWPLYLFLVTISVIDAGFWTVGTILSEQLRQSSFIGAFFLPAYSLPALIVVPLINKFSLISGKKRAAFITALLAGLLLIPIAFISSAWLLVAVVFAFSLFYNISLPEINACFEDYVNRLGKTGDELVGLQASAISLSYIIGPVIVGLIAYMWDNQASFSFLGFAAATVSLLCLIVVPRKIRLPQTTLQNIPA